jgi:drug/metabolite transporter (DMT)-like permease
LVLSLAAGVGRGPLPPAALAYAAALAAATGIAFVATYAAISRIGSARTVIANMLEPVTTVVLAALFLGEAITIRVLAGMVLIVAALPILASVAHRDAGPPAPDTV